MNFPYFSNWCYSTDLDEIGHLYWPEFFGPNFTQVIYNYFFGKIYAQYTQISMSTLKFKTIGRFSGFRFEDFLEIRLYESKLYVTNNYMSRNYMSRNYMSWNYMSRNCMKCYWAHFRCGSNIPEAVFSSGSLMVVSIKSMNNRVSFCSKILFSLCCYFFHSRKIRG